jgi:hypothetical protein
MIVHNAVRTAAAMGLALGLAGCGNIFGGSPAGQQAQAPAAATAQTGGATWQDPKAPAGAAQRQGTGAAGDWDDDNGFDD